MRLIERTKALVKSAFPGGVRVYRQIKEAQQTADFSSSSMEEIFSGIYRKNSWADPESVSGRGSTIARTKVIRKALPALLDKVRAKSLLDASCGDFNWMQHVDLTNVEYTGADVVAELIDRNRQKYGSKGRSFILLNITSDQIPTVDVILCRDCFIHLSYKHIQAAIANFNKSGSRFLLATTHTLVSANTDIQTGLWRPVNLELPPFSFPRPALMITEDPELGKCLGMWSIEELQRCDSFKT